MTIQTIIKKANQLIKTNGIELKTKTNTSSNWNFNDELEYTSTTKLRINELRKIGLTEQEVQLIKDEEYDEVEKQFVVW